LSALFIDTSALAKRYLDEVGASWIQQQIEAEASPANIIFLSELGIVEMFSLLVRRERNHEITPEAAERLRQAFLAHVAYQYLVVPVDTTVFVEARAVVLKHRLRALDAIQLACARRAQKEWEEPITFVTADRELLAAASAEGFSTANPNDYS